MLCLLNHTPGEHCGGCVSGGVHAITSTCQPLVVNRTKGPVRSSLKMPGRVTRISQRTHRNKVAAYCRTSSSLVT